MADSHGNCVSSLRARLLVAAPPSEGDRGSASTRLDRSIRERAWARRRSPAPRPVGYRGAGTVEFIVAAQELDAAQFYFMEMNTRLQVEHPVTEMVTGLDLVELQFRVAAGEPLPLRQSRCRARRPCDRGAALCRESGFQDSCRRQGASSRLHWPSDGGLRIDTGVREGDEVTPFYDPMIAKLIACGRDARRSDQALGDALAATRVLGFATTSRSSGRFCDHPAFRPGEISTGFIDITSRRCCASAIRRASSASPPGLQRAMATSAQAVSGRSSVPWSLAGTPRKDFGCRDRWRACCGRSHRQPACPMSQTEKLTALLSLHIPA